MSFEEYIKVFNKLGYKFDKRITKQFLKDNLDFVDGDFDKYFSEYSFSRLYYLFGWRGGHPFFNFSDRCVWYDLEFIDSSYDYIWFMKRMGEITRGEIKYEDIEVIEDKNEIEYIIFKVNGIKKKWKLEKAGYIADSFFQRFSYLPSELKTKGKYTYFDDGGQQFVIDYATEEEQREFIEKTELKREWLGEGNHFSEPKDKKSLIEKIKTIFKNK